MNKPQFLITKSLTTGPAKIRCLSREELKIEITKFKNISLKIIADMKKMKVKVPGYAKVVEEKNELGVGLEEVKEKKDDDESLFEYGAETDKDDKTYPPEIQG